MPSLFDDERNSFRNKEDVTNRMQEVLTALREQREERETLKEKEKTINRDIITHSDKTEELSKVLYQRKGEMYLPDERANTSDRYVMAIAVTLRDQTDGKLVMSKDAISQARNVSEQTLKTSMESIIKTYNEERGNQYNMQDSMMYKNFPESVINASDFELKVDQLIGYFSDRMTDITGYDFREDIKFDGEKRERPELTQKVKVEELQVGKDSDYNKYIQDLIGSKATLSETERGIVHNALNYQDAKDIIPEKITQKDNLAFIAKEALDRNIPTRDLPLKNATDARRVADLLNRDDRKDQGYYKLSNGEKKFVYEILEKDKDILTNMKGKEVEFKALARGLNGFKNAEERFPNAYDALQKVRNNETLPMTKDGKYDELRNAGEVLKAADMRKEFPGKFTKELDSLLSQSIDKDIAIGVVDRYSDVVDKVPVRSLFIAREHFEDRTDGIQIKTVVPHDDSRNAHAYIKDVKPIDDEAKTKLLNVIDRGLYDQLKDREPMGKVYIDPAYKGIPIPKDTRDESDGGRSITKGTRLDIDKDTQCIRAFIHWKGRDLDLSACLLGKDLEYRGNVSFTNLKDDWAAHSGDITSAPHGASEFIDLRLDKLEELADERDYGYVAFQVNVFSGDVFSKTEECMFGWMQREDLMSGEIYEPKTVERAFELNSESRISTTVLYDIENRQMIWADMNARTDDRNGISPNMVETSINSITAATYHTLHHESPNMYDVIRTNAEARGELVDNPRDADIIYGIDRMSDDTRQEYGLYDRDASEYKYSDMFERASWGDLL